MTDYTIIQFGGYHAAIEFDTARPYRRKALAMTTNLDAAHLVRDTCADHHERTAHTPTVAHRRRRARQTDDN